MNTLTIIIISSLGYLLAYHLYGKFIGHKIFEIMDKNLTPAHKQRDNVDFIPAKKHILFGHHFTTISGLGPIVGPAIGVIWGWLPALLWIFFGSIFMGAAHDFATLIISARKQGRSLGDLTQDIIGPKTKYAFQIIIQFLLWIIVAIFAMIVGILFEMYPQSVFPVWMEVPIALWLGHQIRKGKNDLLYSIIAVILMYITIYIGTFIPITVPAIMGSSVITWALILYAYVFIASTTPVNILLQPRDYINSHQLFIAMGLLLLGFIVAQPIITAPAINPAALAPGTDIPALMPLLFITIACGAISGFHSLASSGTTAKQLNKESDALSVGYGGMITEGMVAILIVMLVAGGLGLGLEKEGIMHTGVDAFNVHYSSWATASGLGAKLEAVITGASNILKSIGIPLELGATIMAVFIVSFAGTSLDSAARIQRMSLQELFKNKAGQIIKPLNNRYFATFIVIALAIFLTFLKPGAKGALILWPMFGALNQLLAALGLMVATMYLRAKGKNSLITFLPMLFMLGMTIWATVLNLNKFIETGDNLLVILSVVILILTSWLLLGAITAETKSRKKRKLITNKL